MVGDSVSLVGGVVAEHSHYAANINMSGVAAQSAIERSLSNKIRRCIGNFQTVCSYIVLTAESGSECRGKNHAITDLLLGILSGETERECIRIVVDGTHLWRSPPHQTGYERLVDYLSDQ